MAKDRKDTQTVDMFSGKTGKQKIDPKTKRPIKQSKSLLWLPKRPILGAVK